MIQHEITVIRRPIHTPENSNLIIPAAQKIGGRLFGGGGLNRENTVYDIDEPPFIDKNLFPISSRASKQTNEHGPVG